MKNKAMTAFAAAALFVSGVASADNFIVISGAKSKNVEAKIEAAGGTVVASYPFGVAVASSSDANFSVPGFTVVADIGFESETPAAEWAAETGFPPNSGDDDFFFDLQWGHNFVGAQQAWDAGVRGAGARVAVIDGGFDLDHPDLAPNINFALSMDFTGEGLQYGLPDLFSHGTHVAGTIAAADNGFGVIGVAPEAELVLLKALSDTGSGSFGDIIAAIYYAALVDVDVINMSLGTYVPRIGSGGDNAGISALRKAVSQAITFAHQSGVTVITSAGNAGRDLDGGNRSEVRFNNGLPHTVGISALTTLNWAGDPDNAFLVPASYTNYGTSMVDIGAPGGSVDYPGNEGCVVAGLARPCWLFDLVFSTGNGSWYWSAGTSMAAPHAAGVAALIISETGNSDPAHVMRELRRRAVDGGKPGRDDYFGHGVSHSGYN